LSLYFPSRIPEAGSTSTSCKVQLTPKMVPMSWMKVSANSSAEGGIKVSPPESLVSANCRSMYTVFCTASSENPGAVFLRFLHSAGGRGCRAATSEGTMRKSNRHISTGSATLNQPQRYRSAIAPSRDLVNKFDVVAGTVKARVQGPVIGTASPHADRYLIAFVDVTFVESQVDISIHDGSLR
jgi:hypothetical protein